MKIKSLIVTIYDFSSWPIIPKVVFPLGIGREPCTGSNSGHETPTKPAQWSTGDGSTCVHHRSRPSTVRNIATSSATDQAQSGH